MTYMIGGRTHTVGNICNGNAVRSFASVNHLYCFGCGYDILCDEFEQHIEAQKSWHAQKLELNRILNLLDRVSAEPAPANIVADPDYLPPMSPLMKELAWLGAIAFCCTVWGCVIWLAVHVINNCF